MGEKKFYICKHCGNMIGMIKSSGVNVRLLRRSYDRTET